MNNNFLSYVIWLPLFVLSTALLAFFFQSVATRRRILKECGAIEIHEKCIVSDIEKLAQAKRGRFTIRELREILASRFAVRDPVAQVLIDAAGTPAEVQYLRIDGLVHRCYGGQLSSWIRTLGHVAVLVALAVTSSKILLALIHMKNADPEAITVVIGLGLISTVFGATLATMAILVNWLILDGPVSRIHHVLNTAVQRIDDAYRVNLSPKEDSCAYPADRPDKSAMTPIPAPPISPDPVRQQTVPQYSAVGQRDNGNGDTSYAPC